MLSIWYIFFNAYSTDEVLDDTEEEIPELDPRETVLHDPPITPEDKLMSQWFCFVQTEDGKIVAVQHPSKEKYRSGELQEKHSSSLPGQLQRNCR